MCCSRAWARSLVVRRTLGEHAIPKALRAEEQAALDAEQKAYRDLRAQATPARRRALDAARQRRARVIARIQSEAKRAAQIAYPKPATIKEVQSRLGPDQVLVEYGPSFALVITPESVRVAELERDRTLRNELHTYLGGACRNLKSPSLIVGGVEDHVHILCRFGRTITTADLLKGLKKESSRWTSCVAM